MLSFKYMISKTKPNFQGNKSMLNWWSDEDLEILEKYYSNTPKKELLKMLNSKYRKKTWAAITKKASLLKIKRDVKFRNAGRPKKKPRFHPPMSE